MNPHQPRILIAAGGTGGHVFPALAVAEELIRHGCCVAWLGTQNGLEARVVPRAGVELFYITVRGVRGRGIAQWLSSPFMLIWALAQSLVVVIRFKPNIVLGMGGFVAGPCGLAAWLLRRPLLIHEQNAVAGLTNRVLARLATRVMEAFPESFSTQSPYFPLRSSPMLTGNPVRSDIAIRLGTKSFSVEHGEAFNLLIFGGSQGADILNEMVPAALEHLYQEMGFKETHLVVVHQAGIGRVASTRARYETLGVNANVSEFIEDMSKAYALAQLVICRAGAMTVAELALAGLPSVLVPYPYATDNHQVRNAAYLSERGGAVVLTTEILSAQTLAESLLEIIDDPVRLVQMASAARACAKPNATACVVRACLEATGG